MGIEKDLAEYRLEQAEQCLKTAKKNFEFGDYKATANRSYYCVFNAIRGLFALERIDFKKHTGVISYFRKNYVKTGIFDKKLSYILGNLFEIRTFSDYEDYYLISRQEITEQIENAEYFLEQIKQYLTKT